MTNENHDPAIGHAAGQLVIDALREAGVDPKKAAGVPMLVQCAGEWAKGSMARDGFLRCCRNMLVFQPQLALEPVRMTVTTERIGE